MQSLSIQLEQPVPVKSQETLNVSQGREGKVQEDSTFQKQLEQAQREQEVQNKKPLEQEEHDLATTEKVDESLENVSEKELKTEPKNSQTLTSKDVVLDQKAKSVSVLGKDVKEKIGNSKDKTNNSSTLEKDNLRLKDFINKKVDNELLDSTDDKVDNLSIKIDTEELSENLALEINESDSDNTVIKEKKEKKQNSTDSDILSIGNNTKKTENQQFSKIAMNEGGENLESLNNPIQKNQVLSEKPIISVIDERTNSTEVTKGAKITTDSVDTNGNSQMSFTLVQDSSLDSTTQTNGLTDSSKSHFSTMLSNQIQTNANEFVKSGSIILRDNNSGTINLILHPEELGNVKISLKLSDKVIAAQITVASEEAYNAFKNSIDALKGAFAAGGFETGGFDLSWTGQDAQQKRQEEANVYAALYQGQLPEIGEVSNKSSNNVNSYTGYAYGMQTVNVMI